MHEKYFGIILKLQNGHELRFPAPMIYSVIFAIILCVALVMVGNKFKNAKINQAPSKSVAVLESLLSSLLNFISDMLGKGNEKYVPVLASVIVYIGFCNLSSLIGLKNPATETSFTFAFAFMFWGLAHYVGLKKHKFRYFKKFTGPVDNIFAKILLTPVELISNFSRPITLSLRLFGNMLAGYIILELIFNLGIDSHILGGGWTLLVTPFLNMFFDIFDALLQALVFTLLVAIFIQEASEEAH